MGMVDEAREIEKLVGFRLDMTPKRAWFFAFESTSIRTLPLCLLIEALIGGGPVLVVWGASWPIMVVMWVIAAALSVWTFRDIQHRKELIEENHTKEEMFRVGAKLRSSTTGEWQPMRWVPLHESVTILFEDRAGQRWSSLCFVSYGGSIEVATIIYNRVRWCEIEKDSKPLCWSLQDGPSLRYPSREEIKNIQIMQNERF